MGGNHMHEHYRRIAIEGENTNKVSPTPESDLDKLNRFLTEVSQNNLPYRNKVLMLKKFVDIAMEQTKKKED